MQTEDDNTDFGESAMYVERNLAAVLACHFGGLWAKYYYLACYNKNFKKFPLDFGINRCF